MTGMVFLSTIPEHYRHPHVLDLSWPTITRRSIDLPTKKSFNQALIYPSQPQHGQWYTAFHITPHIEDLGTEPQAKFLKRIKSSMREWAGFLYGRKPKTFAEMIRSHTLPAMPHRSKVRSTRCPYIDIAWSQYSTSLTTLEVVVHERWSSYCPTDDLAFPALRCLRVKWAASYYPHAAIDLASKAVNLRELGMTVTNEGTVALPHDPRSLPQLSTFRWNVERSGFSSISHDIDFFLQAFTTQLDRVSIQTEEIFNLDVSNLRALSLNLDWGYNFKTNGERIIRQLETPRPYHSLQRLVLWCMRWKTPKSRD
ncbi:hypothetical protein DL96DRAFT_1684124 [Flagelloscypha sp. PMI_526]|nr:hypothetical protein DL96DRAFT_1684124 [Flagelloscypha sp. PMI_526]